jgi:uncharacterized phage infection (PIP) family protein YhgE
MFEYFKKSFIVGIGFAAGVISMTLLAVTVGNVNTFSNGEPLSSSKLNENFGNLKTAIESLNTEVETLRTSLNTVSTDLDNTKTELGTTKTDLSTTQTSLSSASTTLQAADTTLSGRVTTLENNVSIINTVPIGTIVAWHESLPGTPSFPNGWVRCNGQTLSDTDSPLNGQVIPNLNGQKNTWNSKGSFLRGGITSGIFEDDSFQGHWHEFMVYPNDGTPSSNGNDIRSQTTKNNTYVRNPVSDEINGEPRTASETRPVNMSVVWIMKVK